MEAFTDLFGEIAIADKQRVQTLSKNYNVALDDLAITFETI
jgi:hypothetical protein